MIVVNSRFVTLNDSINSDHIKEITILKKESAMPLYGAAEKNGAVFITTEVPDPLYIVDGIEVDNIDGIEASNVESISLLKDKSATELYSEKGKNGVIIITMKKK